MGAERLWFYLRLYPYCVVRSIQAKMSYKSDFILGVTASILMQSLGFVFVWAIFQGIPEMNGWNFYQMVFVYGMSAAALGLNEFLFAGTWRVKMHIHQGTLDRILLRPVGTLFSVLTDDVGLHGLGSVLFGLAVCIVSFSRLHMALSLGKILFWTAAVVCGSLLFFCGESDMCRAGFLGDGQHQRNDPDPEYFGIWQISHGDLWEEITDALNVCGSLWVRRILPFRLSSWDGQRPDLLAWPPGGRCGGSDRCGIILEICSGQISKRGRLRTARSNAPKDIA